MFIQEISIHINSKVNKDELMEKFAYSLLGNYRNSGQIIGSYINESFPFLADNFMKCNVGTLERNSLDKKYNPIWVNYAIEEIEEVCKSKLKVKLLGKFFQSYKGACNCKHRKFLVLFTHVFNTVGPLDCGDCSKVVPIYKLKGLKSLSDFQHMWRWEQNYISCDSLQLNSGVGEKWATKQITEHTSELSKEGLEVCTTIEKLTGYPVYYYLYNYRKLTLAQDKKRKCPSCDGKWLLKKPIRIYDFKCDKCKLLSSLTTNYS